MHKQEEMRGKVVLITGANSGIGKELALRYAGQGATVIVACRSRENGEEAIKEIKETYPDAKLHAAVLDLASLVSVQAFAGYIAKHFKTIDLLLLNAGIHIPYKTVLTVDDYETQYQVNFLSNFLLVHLLMDTVLKSDLKRIVYITSNAHKMATYHPEKLFGFWHLYAVSKLAGMTFAFTLQKLYPEATVFVIAPKRVATNVNRYKGTFIQQLNQLSSRAIPYQLPGIAAEKIMTIAADPANSKYYWYDGNKAQPDPQCKNLQYASTLWNDTVSKLQPYLPPQYQKKYSYITNYAEGFKAIGPQPQSPETLEELKAITVQAEKTGKHISIIGKKHSYNDVFFSQDTLVSLDRWEKELKLNKDSNTVTCGPSVTVRELCKYLDTHGYTLPFAGAFGEQTVVGAVSTGTHGFYRNGGVLSELIEEVTVMLADGSVQKIRDESELQAFRISLGLLGVIISVTLNIHPKTLNCRYIMRNISKEKFLAEYQSLFADNEYFRFYQHPLLPDEIIYFTINTFPNTEPVQKDTIYYFADQDVPNTLALKAARSLLERQTIIKSITAVAAAMHKAGNKLDITITTEFSSFLFINEGITLQFARIVRFGNQIFNNNRDYCFEYAIPMAKLPKFIALYETLKKTHGFDLVDFRVRLSVRATGGSAKALLAPNYGRDTLFMDVFVKREVTHAEDFLRELEQAVITECDARIHWGKEFFATYETIQHMYPESNFSQFKKVKKKFDPDSLFSNPYSKRVLNL